MALASKITKGGNVRSVAKQRSDELRNIRRRYERQAASLRKKAEKAEGSDREYYLKKAEAKAKEAEKYYFKNVSQGAKRGTAEAAQAIENALESEAKNKIARKMLSGSNVGSQFYAATKEVWKGALRSDGKIDTSKAEQLIMDFFGVDNLLNAIDALSKATKTDFTVNDDATKRGEQYEVVSRKGMKAVARMANKLRG